jgi:hypothetical protein
MSGGPALRYAEPVPRVRRRSSCGNSQDFRQETAGTPHRPPSLALEVQWPFQPLALEVQQRCRGPGERATAGRRYRIPAMGDERRAGRPATFSSVDAGS